MRELTQVVVQGRERDTATLHVLDRVVHRVRVNPPGRCRTDIIQPEPKNPITAIQRRSDRLHQGRPQQMRHVRDPVIRDTLRRTTRRNPQLTARILGHGHELVHDPLNLSPISHSRPLPF